MSHQLVYSSQCPNCMRFIGALDRTPAKASVVKTDVNSLPLDQRRHVSAVPMLILSSGGVLVGTKAFEWLKQYDGQMEVESYAGGRGLPYSNVEDDSWSMNFSTNYSAFEPVP